MEGKKKIKCSECEYCREFRPIKTSRSNFTCEHPDKEYIRDYFQKHRIRKMEGFLAFGKRWSQMNYDMELIQMSLRI